MAKKKTSQKGKTTRRPSKAEQARQAAINRMIFSLVLTLLLLFAAARLGAVGVTLYNLIRLVVGSLAYLAIAGIIFYLFGFKWLRQNRHIFWGFLIAFIGLALGYQTFFALENAKVDALSTALSHLMRDLGQFKVTYFVGGGFLGGILHQIIAALFTNIGAMIFAILMVAGGGLLMSPWTIYDLGQGMMDKWQSYQIWLEERSQARKERAEQVLAETEPDLLEMDEQEDRFAGSIDLETGEILPFGREADVPNSPVAISLAGDEEVWSEADESIDEPMFPQSGLSDEGDNPNADDEEVVVDFKPKERLQYRLPSLDLLAPVKPKNQLGEKKIVRDNIRKLEQAFDSFGIKATVERAEIGPSVTKYEVKPATGVRVNRIANLSDDLALALAAKDVRIEAPIPGKSLIGIEVPNSEIATVGFRELWEQAQTDPENLLEIPLGKAVNGSVKSFNLARMPHLLVAGSTGSGKSVAVNGIIASILMKARPDEVKFMMVDPKMVELSVYNDIPHLLIPVVTNPRKASRALQKVVDEMENRYELFSRFGVRNIAGYNAKVAEWNRQSDEKHIPLSLIVVIVDELADLMMVASKEVEDSIIRIGQKARAAGIHMILATQRPSVNVISGLIKANVPSRIAFAVSSGTDSRTILDENGAEKLLGRGDMLFKPIDENHSSRLQGSFISDQEVEDIVTFIKTQAEADYDEAFDPGEVSDQESSSSDGGEGDPLFEEAKALVIETQKASASMIQRRLSVGFNRATRLMEDLEAAGVIGPAEGTKPRKVLQQG
ncbi:FtsK/SpoIIIE family DNA translocase [Streptococcus ovuberis]|uniref:DNA translocase FtsK n=1 Tax=Streptococcus ovuberis TaxID=1936207 RepID=A0A7X6MWQ3_9STRE|nr:DNA translocase FtsK [Streptococcus ovuberis]NKZ19782.1 DNA translocase FtsK [Streptococcus ovuberis]